MPATASWPAPELRLAAGAMRLHLAPALGGAIAGWWHDGLALLRPPAPGAATVRDLASFPLIPFSNRIAQGRFCFAGESYNLPRDVRDARHAMHGNALYAAWQVAGTTSHTARLTLRYQPGEAQTPYFPFAYEAAQTYCLTETALQIGLTLRNAGTRPFPAGFGHHLYFPRHSGAVLRFNASGYWRNGPDGLPAATATDLCDAYARGARIGAHVVDNGFYGWDGMAEISYPAEHLTLRLTATPPLRHAVLFVPEGRDFFAFEPVSHSTDAINRAPAEMRVLAPNETMHAQIVLSVEAR
ncbi:aldose 1-epimerase [Acidocella aquatica]|uniref:Aldose 1-epimerase n=1 Tax=Acidocella aquatica TaxID=1922313 RepID=A0ABQ6AAA8_9PROT|nr:aldose 1-epimerase [Acidocella aquatica]GLR67173.1 aldose 1-epimerase [Acidocella aquatica]